MFCCQLSFLVVPSAFTVFLVLLLSPHNQNYGTSEGNEGAHQLAAISCTLASLIAIIFMASIYRAVIVGHLSGIVCRANVCNPNHRRRRCQFLVW